MEAVRTYATALTTPSDENVAAAAAALADTAVVVGPFGPGEGKEAVLAALPTADAGGLFARGEWSDPAPDGDIVTMRIGFPERLPLTAVILACWLDGSGAITRVEQQMIMAPPRAATDLALPAEVRELVDGALSNGTAMIVAYVDGNGAPRVSQRGSVHVHSDDQIALWIRDAQGGLVKALGTNPQLALFYRDGRTVYSFNGRGRVVEDADARQSIYEGIPEMEQHTDARRVGVAVIVDLDAVEGSGPGGRIRMARRQA